MEDILNTLQIATKFEVANGIICDQPVKVSLRRHFFDLLDYITR